MVCQTTVKPIFSREMARFCMGLPRQTKYNQEIGGSGIFRAHFERSSESI